MDITTVKLQDTTKDALDRYREHPKESYDEVIRKLLAIAKDARSDPQLSAAAVKRIEEARQRFAKGIAVTEDDARRRLGL